MGLDGVYARGALYESVIAGLDRFISSVRDPAAETVRLPPVMSRAQLETSGYLKSFPNLLGCVCALHGSEADIARIAAADWTAAVAATDLVLTPAACYPLYPMAAARGPLPPSGLLFDVTCECFRREPSTSPDRLQSFRMREFVRMGTQADVLAFRAGWLDRTLSMAATLGLAARLEIASDPFFGREGLILAASQIQQALKYELQVDILAGQKPTACMSCNYHRDHFGNIWNIRDRAGDVQHTACVAFGLDRLALALFAAHGTDIAGWPAPARDAILQA